MKKTNINILVACEESQRDRIGNAVPVNFAKNIALAVAKVLDEKN